MHREVARVLIFASTDWWTGGRRPADWMSAEAATPKSRYYALGHERDLLVLQNRMLAGLEALGLDDFGAIQAPEAHSGIYFGGTHRLMTNVDPRIPTLLLDAHSAMIVDAYTPLDADGTSLEMQPAWTHMLTAPMVPPVPRIAIERTNPDGVVRIGLRTQSGFIYQVQRSNDLSEWNNNGAAIVGKDGFHAQMSHKEDGRAGYWRVFVRYE